MGTYRPRDIGTQGLRDIYGHRNIGGRAIKIIVNRDIYA